MKTKSPRKSKTPAKAEKADPDVIHTFHGETIPAAELEHIAPVLRVFAVRVDSLHRDPRNARLHDETDLPTMAASLKRFKQRHLLHYDPDSRVIKVGNGRHEAAEKILKWNWIAAVPSDLPADELKAFALVDNRTAEKSRWDIDEMADQVDELGDAGIDLDDLGFSETDLDELERELEAEAPRPISNEASSGSDGGQLREQWKTVVEHADENEQKAFLDLMIQQGRKCRALNA